MLLNSEDLYERWASALILGKNRDTRAWPLLVQLLTESDSGEKELVVANADLPSYRYEDWREFALMIVAQYWPRRVSVPLLRRTLSLYAHTLSEERPLRMVISTYTPEERDGKMVDIPSYRPEWSLRKEHYEKMVRVAAYDLGKFHALGSCMDIACAPPIKAVMVLELALGYLDATSNHPFNMSPMPPLVSFRLSPEEEIRGFQQMCKVLVEHFGYTSDDIHHIVHHISDYELIDAFGGWTNVYAEKCQAYIDALSDVHGE